MAEPTHMVNNKQTSMPIVTQITNFKEFDLVWFEHILLRYINDGYDEYLYEDNGRFNEILMLWKL